MAKAMVSISLRMTEEGADRLKEVAAKPKNRGLSQGAIVEKLIHYLMSGGEQLEDRILKGEKIDLFRLLGDAFHLAEWGDHAFRKGWVTWSLETYAKLHESASGVEGIQQIARFRLGSSWMDFAMQIRERALFVTSQSEWNEYYMCAIDGLLVSIGYHRLFNNTLKKRGSETSPSEVGAHPVVLYNEACGWSLIANYACERDEGMEGRLATKARAPLKKKRAEATERTPERMKKADMQIAQGSVSLKAIQESKACLDRIQISTRPEQSFGSLPITETHWLFDLAKDDPDLEFLRTADQEYFKRLLEIKEREVSLIKSFHRLRDRIPKEVSDLIPRLQDGR